MDKEPFKTIEDILTDEIGPMATFIMKEQMNAADVDHINPNERSLLRMVDLINRRCLVKLLPPKKARELTSKLREVVKKNDYAE